MERMGLSDCAKLILNSKNMFNLIEDELKSKTLEFTFSVENWPIDLSK